MKNKFNLKGEYVKSWEFIKESKYFILVSILAFLALAIVGFFFPAPAFIESKILEFLVELFEKTKGMGARELSWFIFENNLKSSFFGVLGGIVFGIFPFFSSLLNGYVVGFVSRIGVAEAGLPILWRLAPHGIFELPAIFISFGLGIKLGTFVFKKNRWLTFKNYLLNSIRVFVLVVLPLLIIAAIIEGSLIAFAS
jgi:stage II sporulation protein M